LAIKNNDNLSAVESAILQTITYVDVFDYPLTPEEVHRYLIGIPAPAEKVTQILSNGHLVPDRLNRRDGYFFLSGRAEIVETRRRREKVSKEMWPVARHYGRLLAALPFVRMVAITGSLAVNNVEPPADIDYLIVTEHGRLWSCRAWTILLVRLAARRGVHLCPNYFLSERHLRFEEQNLYTAHELAQMIPISGLPIYRRMRQLNAWTADFLPNAAGIPQPYPTNEPPVMKPELKRLPARLAEGFMRTPPGGWIEGWEMRRKIRKFSRLNGGDESAFSADWCKGHFDGHRRRVLDEFDNQWQKVTNGCTPQVSKEIVVHDYRK
jgi:hypothetical protein